MKEWYLLTPSTRPNEIGGYENDAFLDYKEDAFQESLSTDIASTVTLLNHDLSESKQIRCIIQDNIASTQLKSLERTVLAPIGTLQAGMYILFENVYWLITGYPGNNKIFEKATMILCQHKLKWQNKYGKVIERYANFTSASKYDVGENGNEVIIVPSNNFTIWIPDDDDSATLDGKRVFIDRNTTNPEKVYKITRSDDVLYLFGDSHGGILSFIADRDEVNYERDNQKLGICDYMETHSPTPPESEDSDENTVSYSIIGSNSIKLGIPRIYSVQFKDSFGYLIDPDDVSYQWKITSDFDVEQKINGHEISLRIFDEGAIDSFIRLSISDDNNNILCEKNILVTDIV